FSSAVTVQDAAGNTSSPANQITINIDKLAPTVTLAQPANGSVSNNTTPTFSGTAGTATGDATTGAVDIYTGSHVSGTALESLSANVLSGNYSIFASPALAPGTYTVQAFQSDTAGNTG